VRLLGQTGVKVSRVALGTMSFGGDADEATAGAIWRAALDAGVNLIDTADVYNEGRSEEMVGHWLEQRGPSTPRAPFLFPSTRRIWMPIDFLVQATRTTSFRFSRGNIATNPLMPS